jgi:hypothetical protein
MHEVFKLYLRFIYVFDFYLKKHVVKIYIYIYIYILNKKIFNP